MRNRRGADILSTQTVAGGLCTFLPRSECAECRFCSDFDFSSDKDCLLEGKFCYRKYQSPSYCALKKRRNRNLQLIVGRDLEGAQGPAAIPSSSAGGRVRDGTMREGAPRRRHTGTPLWYDVVLLMWLYNPTKAPTQRSLTYSETHLLAVSCGVFEVMPCTPSLSTCTKDTWPPRS